MTGKTKRGTQAFVFSISHNVAGTLSLLFLLSTAAACGLEGGPDDGFASGSNAITNGWSRDPKTFPVGRTDAPCSISMIGPDVGFTSRGCAAKSKMVELGGERSSIRIQRDMVIGTVGSTRQIEDAIVAVQLRQPVSKHPGLEIDKTPLKSGEVVACFGYNGGALRSGSFRVGDISKGLYYLRGELRLSNNLPYEVSSEDVGGYCQRDGSYAIAGILVQETQHGAATLAPVHQLKGGYLDMIYAASAARQGVAVRILDEARHQYLTALRNVLGIKTSGSTNDGQQAFYLDEVTNPPGGGLEWYRLVDVATGQCATVTGGSPALVQRPCDAKLVSQMFLAEYKNVNGKGLYRFHGSGGVIDRIGGSVPVSINKPSNTSSQWWNMWLTQM